ncbi:MAG: Crp/Fnr family transcriptional regulator [Anaerolineales bacterium]|nr:Crp/Fnr family transcriptional regulator [Anaerolineales bacterium]
MTQPIRNLLASNAIFTTLDEANRETLLGKASPRRYHAGEFLAHNGDIWPFIFIITKGEIVAAKESSEGRSLIVATFSDGEVFWGPAFFSPEQPIPVALKTSQDTEIYLWSRESILPTLLENGEMSWELSRLLVNRMLRANTIIEELAFQSVAGRLARLLSELQSNKDEGAIARSLTLDEMAARIGSTREMVCRFLHQFSDEGIINITRTEFTITNKEKLGELAQTVK